MGLAADLAQRAHVDTLGVHVDDHAADALVLGDIGVGPHQGHADIGVVGVTRPDLLPGDEPATLGPDCLGAQRGEVAAS